MDLNELPSILAKLQDRAGEQEAMRSTMLEIGTSLADIVQLLEKSGAETAKAIADALKGLKLGDIKANVQVPAPVVQMMPAPPNAGWVFEHEYGANGVIKRSTARPL